MCDTHTLNAYLAAPVADKAFTFARWFDLGNLQGARVDSINADTTLTRTHERAGVLIGQVNARQQHDPILIGQKIHYLAATQRNTACVFVLLRAQNLQVATVGINCDLAIKREELGMHFLQPKYLARESRIGDPVATSQSIGLAVSCQRDVRLRIVI